MCHCLEAGRSRFSASAGSWDSACGSPPARPITITGRTLDAVSGRAIVRRRDHDRRPARWSPTPRDASSSTSPLGPWEIEVRARDYAPRTIAFDAAAQGVAPIEIELIPKEGFQERLEVTAPAPRPEGPASIPLRPRQVLSTAGSLDNPFRTLQTLPGVAGTDEFGSKLSVRGGAPDQNLTIMDGVEIHNPYRLFGLTSAFNPETVSRFELLAGGFGAKYGDRLSSVVLIENRDGDAGAALQRVVVAEHHRRQHHRRRTAARTGAGVVARDRAPDVLRSRGGAVRRSGSAVVQRRPVQDRLATPRQPAPVAARSAQP